MADNIDILENRIEKLEKLVFGGSNKDALYPKDGKQFQCTDTLVNVQTKLTKATAGKKKISKVFSKLQDLQECLDPAKADEMTLSDDAKAQLILAEEDFLLQQSVRLETLQQLQDTLDSEHIKGVPSVADKLQELSQIQIQQQDAAGDVSNNIRDLLATYNTVITLLSKQFVKWDEIITSLEQAKMNKKQLD